VSGLTKLLIWAAIVGVIFAFLWWRGYIAKISQFIAETREELRKCSWPTKEELRGATAVVLVTMVLLGLFIMVVDAISLVITRGLLTHVGGG